MLNKIKIFFQDQLMPKTQDTPQQAMHRLQLGVAALLLEMVHMDGVKHPDQCARVEGAIRKHFDISDDEARRLVELAEAERNDATDYFQFTSLINGQYTPEQKLELVEQLWHVALADNELHRHEEHLVRKIAQLLHVPHNAFIAAKHRADNRSG
jgi:uncharacterized tellurite resistance protein B-like protein